MRQLSCPSVSPYELQEDCMASHARMNMLINPFLSDFGQILSPCHCGCTLCLIRRFIQNCPLLSLMLNALIVKKY
jgi:hypothetical protein